MTRTAILFPTIAERRSLLRFQPILAELLVRADEDEEGDTDFASTGTASFASWFRLCLNNVLITCYFTITVNDDHLRYSALASKGNPLLQRWIDRQRIL